MVECRGVDWNRIMARVQGRAALQRVKEGLGACLAGCQGLRLMFNREDGLSDRD